MQQAAFRQSGFGSASITQSKCCNILLWSPDMCGQVVASCGAIMAFVAGAGLLPVHGKFWPVARTVSQLRQGLVTSSAVAGERNKRLDPQNLCGIQLRDECRGSRHVRKGSSRDLFEDKVFSSFVGQNLPRNKKNTASNGLPRLNSFGLHASSPSKVDRFKG